MTVNVPSASGSTTVAPYTCNARSRSSKLFSARIASTSGEACCPNVTAALEPNRHLRVLMYVATEPLTKSLLSGATVRVVFVAAPATVSLAKRPGPNMMIVFTGIAAASAVTVSVVVPPKLVAVSVTVTPVPLKFTDLYRSNPASVPTEPTPLLTI